MSCCLLLTIHFYSIIERQLLESDLLVNILWPIENMDVARNSLKGFNNSNFVTKEDEDAFMLAQKPNTLSNFLVYKRKDAKIAWPSAVSLLCKK